MVVNGNSDGVILFQFRLSTIVNLNDNSFIRKTGSFLVKLPFPASWQHI